jgi:hypothetical protein
MAQSEAQIEAARYAEAQDSIWRATALNAAVNSRAPRIPGTSGDSENKDLLKDAEKYYKFLAGAKSEADSSARTTALQNAGNYPIEGVDRIDRAQQFLDFLTPKK